MGIDLRDDGGLIFGFQLQSQGPATALDLHAINPLQRPEDCVWLHFNLSDRRAIEWVNACAWLSLEGRDLLLSKVWSGWAGHCRRSLKISNSYRSGRDC